MSTTINSGFALLLLFAVAGCAGDRMGEMKMPWQESKKEEPKTAYAMGGRWMLTSPNRGQCNMNFTGPPKATEGSIAPEGGCPGRFFTSRKWSIGEEGKIKIEDHNGNELVQLTPSGTGAAMWFEGQAATGERVMLARQ
jgi:hypothetical protein